MAKKKRTLTQLKQQLTPLSTAQQSKAKGGFSQPTLPGKDLRAGTWTEIDLRITTSQKWEERRLTALDGNF